MTKYICAECKGDMAIGHHHSCPAKGSVFIGNDIQRFTSDDISRGVLKQIYGLLWQDPEPSRNSQAARETLKAELSKDEMSEGIAWANEVYGPPKPTY